MEDIKGKLWWVGPLHVMTVVNVSGIYNPLEVHVELYEFNFHMKSNLKTSISYLLGVCGPMKSKQFCTVFNLLLNCFLLGLHMTIEEEEDQVSNASLLPHVVASRHYNYCPVKVNGNGTAFN